MGAYQAGVLRALNRAGLEFEIISATSIGTVNGMAWNILDLIDDLDQHWLENVINLKPFDASRLLKGKNPFQYHETLDNIGDSYRHRYPFDNERTEVLMTLSDYQTNETVVFSTGDTRMSREDRELAMKASTAILHIGSRPITIQGRKYFDGGFYDNVPVAPLLRYDLDEIWIIPLSSIKEENRSHLSNSSMAKISKQYFQNPYINSLIGIAKQSIHPPNVNQGSARKIVISPFTSKAHSFFKLSSSFVFSVENIRNLLTVGFEDGTEVCDKYLSNRL